MDGVLFDTRRARNATKRSRIDALWVTTLAYYKDTRSIILWKLKMWQQRRVPGLLFVILLC